MEVTCILCSVQLVIQGKIGKHISGSSNFSERFPVNNFALSDEKEKISESLNWQGITDLPLLKTLLAIRTKDETIRKQII